MTVLLAAVIGAQVLGSLLLIAGFGETIGRNATRSGARVARPLRFFASGAMRRPALSQHELT
jgi:hypothetical protein